MQLSKLISKSLPKNCDVNINGLSLDSREIKPGYAFLAVIGTQADGKRYIHDAIARGASVILVDSPASVITHEQKIPVIPVEYLGQKLSGIAAEFYGHPAKSLKIIGVTGTSGKTSCTHYIAQIFDSLGIHCGIIGTLGHGFCDKLSAPGLTTPDAISLQRILRELVDEGAKVVAMEVSSHSIHQGRVKDLDFEIGIFTNLTQDHLDYHGDMESYAAVKRSFLAEMSTKKVVINADDPHGSKWVPEISKQKPVYSYSLDEPRSHDNISSFTYVVNMHCLPRRMQAHVHSPWGMGELSLPLLGVFNLSNALAVLTALCLYGLSFKDVMQQLFSLKPVPGRMQIMGGSDQQPLVIVDYAHKPDALEKALQTLRQQTRSGDLICVFGCGGDRDHTKRQVMARIAEKLADKVIVTNDNPRHEQPEDIVKEIMRGFVLPERIIIELDRSKAIRKSIQLAHATDCVLIAGKGAENYQQIGDVKVPFDDAEQVQRFLSGKSVKLN